jgi:hypothetical protein
VEADDHVQHHAAPKVKAHAKKKTVAKKAVHKKVAPKKKR